jgi:hypothetical protein
MGLTKNIEFCNERHWKVPWNKYEAGSMNSFIPTEGQWAECSVSMGRWSRGVLGQDSYKSQAAMSSSVPGSVASSSHDFRIMRGSRGHSSCSFTTLSLGFLLTCVDRYGEFLSYCPTQSGRAKLFFLTRGKFCLRTKENVPPIADEAVWGCLELFFF